MSPWVTMVEQLGGGNSSSWCLECNHAPGVGLSTFKTCRCRPLMAVLRLLAQQSCRVFGTITCMSLHFLGSSCLTPLSDDRESREGRPMCLQASGWSPGPAWAHHLSRVPKCVQSPLTGEFCPFCSQRQAFCFLHSLGKTCLLAFPCLKFPLTVDSQGLCWPRERPPRVLWGSCILASAV